MRGVRTSRAGRSTRTTTTAEMWGGPVTGGGEVAGPRGVKLWHGPGPFSGAGTPVERFDHELAVRAVLF